MESSEEQNSAPDFDRSDLEREMRRLKLKALEAHADFGFIVGEEKDIAELMHCFKSDLLAASEYFEGLLRSPCAENPPVWIKHIQPHIFKMVLKFVSVQTVEEDLSLEDAISLALAADEFLLMPLKGFCASEIKRLVTVETVWSTLNSIVRIQVLPEACSRVLSLETKKCLEHDSFLAASEESFIFLLDLETLAIDSELELIKAALKLAKIKPEKEEVEMMKAIIPHLRLLTLPMDKLDQLSKYLSNSQMVYLAKRLIFKEEVGTAEVSPPLNLSTSLRSQPKRREFKFEFISEDLIKSDWQMMGLELKKSTTWNTLKLELVAEQHLIVKGIEILTQANNSPNIEFVSSKNEASSRISTLKEEYQEDMEVSVFITLKGAESRNVFFTTIQSKQEYNSWFSVDFGKKVFVPKGAKFELVVRSANVYQLIPFSILKKNVDNAEKYAAFSEFGFCFFVREHKGDEKYTPMSLEKDGNCFFSIKSLSVVPVDEKGHFDMNFEG